MNGNVRQEWMNSKHTFNMLHCPEDYQIASETIIDENGIVKTIEREVLLDYKSILLATPAYTSKIEYIEKYGTIDKNGIIQYHFCNGSQLNNITEEEVRKIIVNNLKSENDE